MTLKFDVDGKTTQKPSPEDIAAGFASIEPEGSRSISMIMLERPPFTLWAFGHPKEGYTLDLNENVEPKGTQTRKVTSPAKMIPQGEVVRVFQSFARGEDSWQQQFQWDDLGIAQLPSSIVFKRLAVIIGTAVLLFLLLKYVLRVF